MRKPGLVTILQNELAEVKSQRDELLEAARNADCDCNLADRISGHRIDCWMPDLQRAIAKAEGRA